LATGICATPGWTACRSVSRTPIHSSPTGWLAACLPFKRKLRRRGWVKKNGIFPDAERGVAAPEYRPHRRQSRIGGRIGPRSGSSWRNTQFNGWAFKNRAVLLPARAQVEKRGCCGAGRRRSGSRAAWKSLRPHRIISSRFPKACLHGWGRVFMTVAADGRCAAVPDAREIRGLNFASALHGSLKEICLESEAFPQIPWHRLGCRAMPKLPAEGNRFRAAASMPGVFAKPGMATLTDPACSLAPGHHLITEALAEAGSDEALIYRTARTSLELS